MSARDDHAKWVYQYTWWAYDDADTTRWLVDVNCELGLMRDVKIQCSSILARRWLR